jgi:signal recognition particle receptor subunit beta
VVAGQLPASGNGGEGGGEDILVFTTASTCPEQAWKRLAGESSAWVLLANANDADSLRSTRADLEFVRGLGKVPFVIATYMSMAGEEMSARQITRALALEAGTPVLSCQLRDRESVASVVRRALELAAAGRGD